MRLVGQLSNENDARRICNYLQEQDIQNNCEVSFDPQSGRMGYQLWIHDEDRIEEANNILKEFNKNPLDSKFNAPEPEPQPAEEIEGQSIEQPPPTRYRSYLTNILIGVCAVVFFINTMQQASLTKEGVFKQNFVLTPIQALFMYDLPPAYEKLDALIEQYGLDDKEVKNVPTEVAREVLDVNKEPYFKGIYAWVVNKIKKTPTGEGEGALFIKIRQGEIWRLITPVVLHKDLLHILFNMLWLWYLGRPIEQRIGPIRTLLLSLIAGVGSNTIQYFMSGPFFIGYSGIITALAGFIWMRERIAPWEGYPLNRGTIYFLLFFILAVLGLQVAAFFIQIFTAYDFAPNIANTAHISGAVIGVLLGRLKVFAQKVHA